LFFKKKGNINKLLATLNRRQREKIQINKIGDENDISQQKPLEPKGSLGNIFKTLIQIN
jgi:hypothetical protein